MQKLLELDDELVGQIEEETRRSGESFQNVLNWALRLGLKSTQTARPFVVTPRKLGLPDGMSYDNLGDLLEQIEGPIHR